MIIAITSDGKTISSNVDPRFGRSKYFIIYNTDDKTFITYDNFQNLSSSQGAGIQTAQNIAKHFPEALITGNCGPKAYKVLYIANIKVYIAKNCTIENAISDLLKSKLTELNSANVEGHWV